jgi:transcriptional regulator with XRE-family HTH domain
MKGEYLKHEILRRGFTLKSIADVMGITNQSFGNRLGSDNISTETLEAVAQAMGVSISELYGDTLPADNEDSILESKRRERELLRSLSTAAMQGLLSSEAEIGDDMLKGVTTEQFIARRSMKFAKAMLDEFKKHGIDK